MYRHIAIGKKATLSKGKLKTGGEATKVGEELLSALQLCPLKNKSNEHTVLELRGKAHLQVCRPRQKEGLLGSSNHRVCSQYTEPEGPS